MRTKNSRAFIWKDWDWQNIKRWFRTLQGSFCAQSRSHKINVGNEPSDVTPLVAQVHLWIRTPYVRFITFCSLCSPVLSNPKYLLPGDVDGLKVANRAILPCLPDFFLSYYFLMESKTHTHTQFWAAFWKMKWFVNCACADESYEWWKPPARLKTPAADSILIGLLLG